MKYIEELAALPVRYFCNYSLLGGLGVAFELLVFGIRQGGLDLSANIQAITVAAMLVTILQTAAEYFIPQGKAGFLPRLAASVGHMIIFTGLILLQINVEMPTFAICGLLGILFWIQIFFQICFSGKGNFLLLPSLFFAIFLLLPALDGAAAHLFTPKAQIIGNILLFLFVCTAWYKRNSNATKKEQLL